MPDALTALDGTFLELEELNEGAPMHIGGVMVFDPPLGGRIPTIGEVRNLVDSRLAAIPRYRERLDPPHVRRLAWPCWVPDDVFETANHVSRATLPSPGSDAELCDWVGDFYSHRLDRTRPLWELVLLDGLEDGRWALAQKVHHCMVDGVGSVGVLERLLDDESQPASPSARGGLRAPARAAASSRRLPGVPAPVAQASRAGAQAIGFGWQAGRHPLAALQRSQSIADVVFEDEILGAPHCSLNVPIGSTRSYGAVRCLLSELRAVRAELGGSVNDVLLAACAGGLRRLLLERGEEPPAAGLRAMVPVNLRHSSERLELGNRVSSLFVTLPVAEPGTLARHERIVRTTRGLKISSAAQGASTLVELGALAPPVVHALIARGLYGARLFNLTITNVPGAREPRYAFGSQLREVLPFVPLAAEHAVGIAIFSHEEHVVLGFAADQASMPDLGVLVCGVEEELEELLAVTRARVGPERA